MNMRKIIAILAAMLMLCSIIPMGAMVSAAAAVVNSDFEDGTVGSWTTSSSTALAIVAAADLPVANSNGGNYALYFESSNYSYVNYKMTVKANTTYKISVDVLSASDRNPVNIRMRTTSSSDAATQSYTPVTDAWTTYSYVFDSGANTTLNFRMQAGWSTSKFYFDNVSCVEYIEPESPVLPDDVVYYEGFELNPTTWGSSDGGAVEIVDAASAPVQKATNGYYVLKHTVESGKYPYVYNSQGITVEPNTDYILSMDLLNTSSGWPLKIQVGTNYWFGTVVGASVDQKIKPSNTTWENYSIVFNSGENTKVYVGVRSQYANTTIYVDNVYVAPLHSVANDGYIMNGDFETGTGLEWLHTTNTEIIADPTESGQGYVMSTAEAVSGGHMFSQPAENLVVGEEYVLSFKVYGHSTATNSAFWVKFPSAFTTWSISTTYSSATGKYNNYTPRINVNSDTNAWHEVDITFTAQEATAVIDFMNYRADQGYYYFDDISITHVHKAGAAATCENAQVCTVCNVELAPALGHSYNEGICGNCGAADPNYVPPHTCEFVGVETLAPTCENDGIMTYSCECGEGTYTETIPALGHTAGAAADCENAQTCTVCGEVLNAALGHDWADATCTAPKTCSVCSATEGEALEHTYDNEFDVDCNACGAVREVAAFPVAMIGKSISEDVNGYAVLFDANAEGLELVDGAADYTNATYEGYKLLGLGVTASNGNSSVTIEGLRVWGINDETGALQFAFRIINIPAAKLDTEITMVPYYTVEIDGVATNIEGEAVVGSYTEIAG